MRARVDTTKSGLPFVGRAVCAEGDNFNKERGRKLALSRALEDTALSKADKREVWLIYFEKRFKDADKAGAGKNGERCGDIVVSIYAHIQKTVDTIPAPVI